ncbi:MAG: hypothetical protein WC334_00960 [Kiritimatiellales bacterium]|jgi:hypothetical protein
MASSDIYEVKEPAWAKKAQAPVSQQRRRHRRHRETFDDAVNKDISGTHRRRRRNSGFRRFRHRMKNPEFNRKFWITTLGTSALILVLLIVWDMFFRYPKLPPEQTQGVYRIKVE